MTFPKTIAPYVSPAAIGKVTRLFNGSLLDILNELFQNARRAGASRVCVRSGGAAEARWMSVEDDGHGIADPAQLLALGASGWDEDTVVREDPAGMGLFALAGHMTWIESGHDKGGFRLVIPADGWTGQMPLQVESNSRMKGTSIRFVAGTNWCTELGAAVAKTARHYPLAVDYDGNRLESCDFLEGAEHIEEALGVRIGVFARDRSCYEPSINFHGVTIAHRLPNIAEAAGPCWSVKIDVVDAPELVLVLPARKEVVETPFLEELDSSCRAAIYRAIAARGAHGLGYRHYCEAQKLGVTLPYATAALDAWHPPTANDHSCNYGKSMSPCNDTMLVGDMSAIEGQLLNRAIDLLTEKLCTPLCANEAYLGYPWYDALPQITSCEIKAKQGRTSLVCSASGLLSGADRRIDEAWINITILAGKMQSSITTPLDVVIGFTDDLCTHLDDAVILVTKTSQISPEDLADLLEAALFEYWQDCEADSYDSQQQSFTQDALHRAHQLLSDPLTADLARIENAARIELGWMVPRGRCVTITLGDAICKVSLKPVGARKTKQGG